MSSNRHRKTPLEALAKDSVGSVGLRVFKTSLGKEVAARHSETSSKNSRSSSVAVEAREAARSRKSRHNEEKTLSSHLKSTSWTPSTEHNKRSATVGPKRAARARAARPSQALQPPNVARVVVLAFKQSDKAPS